MSMDCEVVNHWMACSALIVGNYNWNYKTLEYFNVHMLNAINAQIDQMSLEEYNDAGGYSTFGETYAEIKKGSGLKTYGYVITMIDVNSQMEIAKWLELQGCWKRLPKNANSKNGTTTQMYWTTAKRLEKVLCA